MEKSGLLPDIGVSISEEIPEFKVFSDENSLKTREGEYLFYITADKIKIIEYIEYGGNCHLKITSYENGNEKSVNQMIEQSCEKCFMLTDQF